MQKTPCIPLRCTEFSDAPIINAVCQFALKALRREMIMAAAAASSAAMAAAATAAVLSPVGLTLCSQRAVYVALPVTVSVTMMSQPAKV